MPSVQELRAAIERESPQEREARLERAAQDPTRPRYHYLPTRPAWMNDPNGPIYWKGEYHMFFQYNPDKPYHGSICWGHVVSPDLVHWQELPIALRPEPGGTDQDGCWTGCAVDANGTPMLIYTGVHPEVQIGAVGDDRLLTWQKVEPNPLIGAPPAGIKVTGFRDPCVWREGNEWLMLIGSGIQEVGGTSLLYRSPDLRRWEYLHPFYAPDPERPMHECPDFFPLGDRWALLTSWHGSHIDVGRYDEEERRFVSEWHGLVDYGRYYAPKTYVGDPHGRRVIFGWVQEARSAEEQIQAGWSGVLSLPRLLEWQEERGLRVVFAPELHSLRDRSRRWERIQLSSEHRALPGLEGGMLELKARFAPGGSARRYGLIVQGSDELLYDREEETFAGVPFRLTPNEPMELHVYVDHSVIEVIVNERFPITLRSYHAARELKPVFLAAEGGTALVQGLEAWTLRPIDARPAAEG